MKGPKKDWNEGSRYHDKSSWKFSGIDCDNKQ